MPDEDHSRDASIELYADGSFCHEAAYGAWAFRVPALNLEGVGSSEGRTVTRFELLGVLKRAQSDDKRRPLGNAD
jgi:hypothetical protein